MSDSVRPHPSVLGDLCVALSVTDLHSPGLPPYPEQIPSPVSPAQEEPKEGQALECQRDWETRVTPPETGTGE